MADLTSRLIIQLVDQVSSTARRIAESMRGLNGVRSRLGQAIERNNRQMADARGHMVDAGVTAYAFARAFMAPVKAAADFESAMLDIGQKADLSDGQIKGLGDRIKGISRDLGKGALDVAGSVDSLMGSGMNVDDAMAIVPAITKAATAYRGSMNDISEAGFAVMSNLHVPAAEFAKSLDIMSQSGKEGKFELRDMAKEFPSLTAQAQALGMKGTMSVARLSAALQIARKGAGTSAEAANNTGNLMQKIISPETTKKFKKFGIDIRKELKKTQREGGDVFEMIARKTTEATKGDLSKIGDIFQDRQVQGALLPLIQNLEEYRRIRDKAFGASGVVDEDFNRRWLTANVAMGRLRATMGRMSIAIGSALLPPLVALADKLAPIIEAIGRFAEANPELVSTLLQVAAAMVALNVAGAAFRFLALGFAGTALRMGYGLLTLRNPLALVRLAFIGLRAALISTGIGAILVAIAMAGQWIYNNWSGLQAMFEGFADAIKTAFPGLQPIFASVASWIGPVIGVLSDLTGKVNMTTAEWRALGVSIGEAVAGAANRVRELPGRILAFFQALPGQLRAIGVAAMRALADGIVSAATAVLEKVQSIAASIKGAFSNIASGSGIDGKGGARPATGPYGASVPFSTGGGLNVPRKASGGDVDPGAYWVGEKGPEIFRTGVSGSITPNHALPNSGGQRVQIGAININGVTDPEKVADEVQRRLSDMLGSAMRGAFA